MERRNGFVFLYQEKNEIGTLPEEFEESDVGRIYCAIHDMWSVGAKIYNPTRNGVNWRI